MKTLCKFVLLVMILALLCGCNSDSPISTETVPAETTIAVWSGYAGTMEGYEPYYTEERNKLWEEDVLYLAETFLSGHPKLANANFVTQYFEAYGGESRVDYSNMHYDEALRNQFIQEINLLIPQLSELSDAHIRYEFSRIIALLECAHSASSLSMAGIMILPLCFEPIEHAEGFSLCTVRASEEYRDLLGSQLTAINGVPIETIVEALSAYIPHENDYWPVHMLTMIFDGGVLPQRYALSVIGIVDPDAESVEATFQTADGTRNVIVEFVSEYDFFIGLEMFEHKMISNQSARFQLDQNYWYITGRSEEGPYIYVRFVKMQEMENYTVEQLTLDVSNLLRDAEEPVKLMIDFRNNNGGRTFDGAMNRFAKNINKYETAGTYILINGGSFSAGSGTAFVLSKTIEGAKLVGTPAGQPPNCSGAPILYSTPNYEVTFKVSDNYLYSAPGNTDDAIYPDITVYQSWEDYQNGIDTVLKYVVTLG